jgi:3-phytase
MISRFRSIIPNTRIRWRLQVAVFGIVIALSNRSLLADKPIKEVAWSTRCADGHSQDQDDLCLWVHPADASQSVVIAADKAAGKLWVYDLEGRTIQSVAVRRPGNIDVRYHFPLGEKHLDIVACNQREGNRIVVYGVNPALRQLERIDDGSIATSENYGGALYRSTKSGKFYFITTSYPGHVEQYELHDNGKGQVTGHRVRSWKVGLCEAAVADDKSGQLYIGEERRGIWAVGAEPQDATLGELVVRIGQNGLTGDVEGLGIYHSENGKGYLVVSNQASNNFHVYRRDKAHTFVGAFAIKGAKQSDGIDICNRGLGARFPKGLFACHAEHGGQRPVLLARWDAVAEMLSPKLSIDTAPDPRK